MLWNSLDFRNTRAIRLADPLVRIDLDAIVSGLAVADRDGEIQLAAPCFLAQGLERALPRAAAGAAASVAAVVTSLAPQSGTAPDGRRLPNVPCRPPLPRSGSNDRAVSAT